MRILMPPATQSLEYKDADLAAFYEYYSLYMEPWDGPAGMVVDGRALCRLRHGPQRPAPGPLQCSITDRRAHHAGLRDRGVRLPAPESVVAKGRAGSPGQMIAVDTETVT